MAQLQFNATQHTPATDFEILPAGWYAAVIDESEIKPTSTGGKMLVLRYTIIDGYGKGQKTWKRLNIENANQTAMDIAFGELSAICGACGFQGINDSSELHNIPHNVKLKVNPAKGDYEASNEAKAWKHINEEVTYVQGAPASAQTQTQAQGGFNNAQQGGFNNGQQTPAGQGIQQPVQQQAIQQQAVQQTQQAVQQPVNQGFNAQTAPAQQWQQPVQQPVQQQAVQQQATAGQVQQNQEPVQQAQQAVQQTQQQAAPQGAQTGKPAWAQNNQ